MDGASDVPKKNEAAPLPDFEAHPLRDSVLGEVHARPFRPISTPRIVLLYGFVTNSEQSVQDREWFSEFCGSHGAPGPGPSARYHTLPFAGGTLSWERHAEFTTYTWDGAAPSDEPFGTLPSNHPFGKAFRAPGQLIVATRLDVLDDTSSDSWRRNYDPVSLTFFSVQNGAASVATDFRPDGNGLTRYLVLNKTMTPIQTGAVTQRLLEIETYRNLALLGLFEANRLQPSVGSIESELVELTDKMQDSAGLDANRTLLDKLSRLAASLEAGAAASSFRFGASRAYYEIVNARLKSLDESHIAGELSMSGFLNRRLGPAMRTCQSVEERQANLSRKLARATTLLRTRVDVDLEQQNRGLLQSMNRRARLQLRLQQTVEGLSVAAVSYYIVGLFSYIAKGAQDAGWPVPAPGVTTAIAVPIVVAGIWITVRNIRKRHAESDKQSDKT
ncbi:putative membrane-anchored protein [Roseibium hamelinense]|uniref:Putative membrane-anchored protein n=1 Tax=Roseibium hamelinense TaxID=150831 RepID=A0A562T1J2_9HYPH|nr:DUF3422 domain-containing protein [Roseibium hamelinense]MTI43346.1 DUF3422 domain-containing protein [Roseibium hamelinense]TWI87545.1 putative membrane-anchored protein [Roseibium hamelinense]